MNYEKLTYVRDETVDGVGPWHWLKADSGAWDGPKRDWEEHHSKKWFEGVTDYRVCVQAGACLGMYPRLLARKFDVVYAFEPDRLNFYVANLNLQEDNVFPWNAALGIGGDFAAVERQYADNVGMNRIKGRGPVPLVALDSLELPCLGLLALDVEGYEHNALLGARRTIERCSPVVVCERPDHNAVNLLKEMGYLQECESVADAVFVRA